MFRRRKNTWAPRYRRAGDSELWAEEELVLGLSVDVVGEYAEQLAALGIVPEVPEIWWSTPKSAELHQYFRARDGLIKPVDFPVIGPGHPADPGEIRSLLRHDIETSVLVD